MFSNFLKNFSKYFEIYLRTYLKISNIFENFSQESFRIFKFSQMVLKIHSKLFKKNFIENFLIFSQIFLKIKKFSIVPSLPPGLKSTYATALLTIPVSSASAEPSFLKLKLIKTRFRSSMEQELLSFLGILSI